MVHDLICDVPLNGFVAVARWYSKVQLYLARFTTEETVKICSEISLCEETKFGSVGFKLKSSLW